MSAPCDREIRHPLWRCYRRPGLRLGEREIISKLRSALSAAT
uniref:Uncharacterized protein n=1 Tax=Triticum urartu TaxID=4572 RepID=A0A8R7UPF6_TRIUA